MAISLGAVKRGDTLAFVFELKDGDDPVLGVSGRLRCQIRAKENSKSTLLGEFAITESGNSDGKYNFVYEGDTRLWPAKVYFDIEWEDGGKISSTETFSMKIKEDITNG